MFVYFAVVTERLGQHLEFVPFSDGILHRKLRHIFILSFICFSHCSVSSMTGVRPLLLGGLLVFPVSQLMASVSVLFMLRGGNLAVLV